MNFYNDHEPYAYAWLNHLMDYQPDPSRGRERKEMPDRNIDDKDQNGWNQGVAYVVAMLIRTYDEPSIALEIWEHSGATLHGVCMYDRVPINEAKRKERA